MGAVLPWDHFPVGQVEMCLIALRVGLRLPAKPQFSSFSAGWSLGCDPELPSRAAGHPWGQECAAGHPWGQERAAGPPGRQEEHPGTC